MALSANFVADFSSFFDAVDKANSKLVTFEDNASTVGKALDRMVTQFSGTKLIQQASVMVKAVEDIGGVAKLTDAELRKIGATVDEAVAKMKKMGIAVPESFTAIQKAAEKVGPPTEKWYQNLLSLKTAVSGLIALQASQWVLGFAKDLLASADALTKLNAQTGISIEWLQRLQIAGDDAGVSIEDIAAAASYLQKQIGSGDKSTIAAIEKLGLSVADLKTMSQGELFATMVTSLGDVHDQLELAATSQEVFGKGATHILPLVKRGIEDVRDAFVASDHAWQKLDDWGDKLGSWWRTGKGVLAEAVVFLGEKLPDAVALFTGSLAGRKMQESADLLVEINKQLAIMDKTVASRGPAGMPKALPKIEIPDAADVRALDKEIEKLAGDNEKAAKAAADHAKALADFRQSMITTEGVAIMMAGQIRSALTDLSTLPTDAMGEVLAEGIARSEIAFRSALAEAEVARDLGAKIRAESRALLAEGEADATRALNHTLAMIAAIDSQVGPQIDKALLAARNSQKALGEFFKTDLPRSILAAVQGGGDVLKSVGSTIGNYLLDPKQSGIGASIAANVAKLPGLIAGPINAILPGVGSLIGPAVAKVGGWIKGLFTGGEGAKVNDLRDQFVAAAGGINQLNIQAQAAGMTLDNLLAAKKVTAFESAVKELSSAFDFQKTSIDAVYEAAQRYGFTLNELGPALQRQELDKQAQQLFKDYEILTSAGLDLVAVHERMSATVSDYVNNAVAMGVEIPSAMRPMLESFVQAGTLLDASGNAITNLEDSGISFALTMSEGFKSLIDEVKKLTDAIARGLGLAITNVPPLDVKGNVTWNVPPIPTPGAGVPMESYQEGTDGFRNFGAGTPAMLHGWEAVVPRDESSGLLAPSTASTLLGPSAAGGAATIVVNAQGAFFDTPGDLQRLADKVNDALTAKYGLRYMVRAA